jgi:hypothetical protein
MPYLCALILLAPVASQLFKKSKRQTARRPPSRRTNRHDPIQLPKTNPAAPSLRLPAVSPTANNPLDRLQRSDNLLTPAELAFFAALEPHIHSSHRISAKVRLADLFNAAQGPGQQTAFNKIVGKHIDFVITDAATSRILCGIELDDSSHSRPERIERDRFVNDLFARHSRPLLRIPFSWTYYPQGLRTELAKAGLAVAAA